MRTYTNAKGEGRLFSVDMADESGAIRGTFFNQDADRWFSVLQMGQAYLVSKGQIKVGNKKFCTFNEYEITFGSSSTFDAVMDSSLVPNIAFKFVSIDKIESTAPNSTIDIVGVLEKCDAETSIVIKNGANAGKSLPKRDIHLIDSSGKSVPMTLWDAHAQTINESLLESHPVIAVRQVRVSDYQGRSLSTTRQSAIEVNPSCPEAHILRGWYDTHRAGITVQSISGGVAGGAGGDRGPTERVCLSAIKERNLGLAKPDYFSFVGYINFIKQDNKFAYAACPLPDVNTKVVPVSGGWWCEKTQRTFPNCDWRYILSFTVADHTSQTWVSTFNDVGKKIMGIDANQLTELQNSGENTSDYFDKVQWQLFNFKVRAKTETYQNEPRVKVTVLEAEPVRYNAAQRPRQTNQAITVFFAVLSPKPGTFWTF